MHVQSGTLVDLQMRHIRSVQHPVEHDWAHREKMRVENVGPFPGNSHFKRLANAAPTSKT